MKPKVAVTIYEAASLARKLSQAIAVAEKIADVSFAVFNKLQRAALSKAKKHIDGNAYSHAYSNDFSQSTSTRGITAQIQEFVALISGKDALDNRYRLVVDWYWITIYANCANAFILRPFICMSENGYELQNHESTTTGIADVEEAVS